MGGVAKFVANVGKELTGDASRERKRAARDAQTNAALAQQKILDDVENEKKQAAQDEAEKALNKAAIKASRKKSGSTGRKGTILSGGSDAGAAAGAGQKTLLGT